MLQIIKATVNGVDGFIVTRVEKGQPISVAFTDPKELLDILKSL